VNPRKAPFTLLLPLFSLTLWIAIIAIPATLVFLNLRTMYQRNLSVDSIQNTYSLRFPRNQFLVRSVTAAAIRSGHTIEALDTPAFSIQLLFDRFSPSWPMEWTPIGLDFFAWRAVIFPIYCLPFWWFVGLGVDGLLKRRLLGWPVYLLGTFLCIGFIVLTIGLTFGVPREDHQGFEIYLCGFALWVILFGVFPAGWIRTWLKGRRSLHANQHDHQPA
jgi:hypothetical protein